MHKLVFVVSLVVLLCGCRSEDVSNRNDPIVSPTNISTESGSGEIQIPHYVPTWYENK